MNSPDQLATALRHQADGVYCLEAAANLLIAQTRLHRTDFTIPFMTLGRGLIDGRLMATVDWPAAITALDSGTLPCSGGEQRMLRLTASLADGVPSTSATHSPASTSTTLISWPPPYATPPASDQPPGTP
jgi:hypothetical protein